MMFSKTEKDAIAQAISQSEKQTSAELVMVITASSDAYLSYRLLGGLAAGSLASMILWSQTILTFFPLLIGVQLLVTLMFCVLPPLRHLCEHLVPAHTKRQRAAHRAFEEYLRVTHHVAATVPVAVLYVSLGERYAHMLTSRLVREHISETMWNELIAGYTQSIARDGLAKASVDVIGRSAGLLARAFPQNGSTHSLSSHLIERN